MTWDSHERMGRDSSACTELVCCTPGRASAAVHEPGSGAVRCTTQVSVPSGPSEGFDMREQGADIGRGTALQLGQEATHTLL